MKRFALFFEVTNQFNAMEVHVPESVILMGLKLYATQRISVKKLIKTNLLFPVEKYASGSQFDENDFIAQNESGGVFNATRTTKRLDDATIRSLSEAKFEQEIDSILQGSRESKRTGSRFGKRLSRESKRSKSSKFMTKREITIEDPDVQKIGMWGDPPKQQSPQDSPRNLDDEKTSLLKVAQMVEASQDSHLYRSELKVIYDKLRLLQVKLLAQGQDQFMPH